MNGSAGVLFDVAGRSLAVKSLTAMMLHLHWCSKLDSQISSYPWCGCITILLSDHYAGGTNFRRFLKAVLGCFIFEKSEIDL